MIRRWFRRFGTFVVGFVLIAGGCSAIAYGILLFYVSLPLGIGFDVSLTPIESVMRSVVTDDRIRATLVIGVAGFALEIRENGVWPRDDRTHQERLKDMRREWARERDAWRPPPEDRDESTSMYEDLQETLSTDRPELIEATLKRSDDSTRVQGRIENDSINRFSDLQVQVQFLAETGETLGTGAATKTEIGPNESWQFEVFYRGEGVPADFRIRTSAADE